MCLKSKSIILVSAFIILSNFAGCQKLKSVFKKPSVEGVVEESLTIPVYAYRSSVVVNATPQELLEYISDVAKLRDTSSAFGLFQFKVEDSIPELKIIEVGFNVDIFVKIVGVRLPCRVLVTRYSPERELWLMILTGDSWLLGRIDIEPYREKTKINLEAIGRASDSLAALIDTFSLQEAVAQRIDLWMAAVQAEFDPELDVKRLTEKGLRGELYRKFLQANEASIWVDSPPEEAVKRGLNPDNFRAILETGKVEGLSECLFSPENLRKWESPRGGGRDEVELIPCLGTRLRLAGFEWKGDDFVMINPGDPRDFFTLYSVRAGSIVQLKIQGEPERGGTLVKMEVAVEPPGSTNPDLMEALISISGISQWIEKMLLDIRARAEGLA